MLRIEPATVRLFWAALGAVVLYDKYIGWSSICDFFSWEGMLPLEVVPDLQHGLLHGWSDRCEWPRLLAGLQLLLGGLLLLGRGGRGCCACLWVLYLSERCRTRVAPTGGDGLLAAGLLWGALLEGGRASPAALGVRLQVCLMYLFAALNKLDYPGEGSLDWVGGRALEQSLACPTYTTALGDLVSQQMAGGGAPRALGGLATRCVPLLQMVCPAALLLTSGLPPRCLWRLRWGLWWGLVAMHLGMGLVLHLGVFSPACLAILVVLLPPRGQPRPATTTTPWLSWGVAVALLGVTVLATFERNPCSPSLPGGPAALPVARALYLPVRWTMFSGSAGCPWVTVAAHLALPGEAEERPVDLHRYTHEGVVPEATSPPSMGKTPLWEYMNYELVERHTAGMTESRDRMADALGDYYCRRYGVHNLTVAIRDHAPNAPEGLLPEVPPVSLATRRCRGGR